MNKKTVFLLAGHNIAPDGKGTGAHGFIDEAVEAVRVRNALTERLEQLGLTVSTDSDEPPLSQVIKWLKSKARAGDIVIDIHFNAATPKATGTEVFVPNDPSETELLLASLLAEDVASTLDIPRRSGKLLQAKGYAGVKYENESQHTTLAALSALKSDISVLIEICFVTNKEDCEKYNANFDALIAEIADTIYLISKKP